MWIKGKLKPVEPIRIDGFEIYSGGIRCEFVKYAPMNWYRFVCIGHPAIETHWLEDK